MLMFVGDPRVRSYTNERLLPRWTRLRLGQFRGAEDVHERLEIVASDHPIFEGLEEEARATLEEVRLRNFFRLDETVGRPLIRFAGGGAAVTEVEVGRGRLIVCGFETSAVAGDLPFSPMFLPVSRGRSVPADLAAFSSRARSSRKWISFGVKSNSVRKLRFLRVSVMHSFQCARGMGDATQATRKSPSRLTR